MLKRNEPKGVAEKGDPLSFSGNIPQQFHMDEAKDDQPFPPLKQ